MSISAIQMIAGAYGNAPNDSGAATVTFTKPIYGFLAKEDTTITVFKNAADATVTTGWESKVIEKGDLALFSQPIKKITVTSGGKGIVFNAE